MKHTVKCLICQQETQVNGQKGIDKFREQHAHYQLDSFTGKYIKVS